MIVSIISLNQKVSQSIKIDWEVRVKNEKKLIIEIFVFKVFAPSTKESVTLGKEHYQCKGGGLNVLVVFLTTIKKSVMSVCSF